MPNRIVRQSILDSDRVNKLSWAGEVFYRRLMSIVDDMGRYDARISMIRSSLYPLKLDHVSDADVAKWLGECSSAGLVSVYEVDNKKYLEIYRFNQVLRIKKSKYPPPEARYADAMQVNSECMSEENPNPKQESEYEGESDAPAQVKNYAFSGFTPPSLAMCEDFFTGCGKTKELGAKFFYHYNGLNWRVSGSQIENWLSIAQKWVLNEKSFENGKQTGNNSNRFSEQKRGIEQLEHLANEILRQP